MNTAAAEQQLTQWAGEFAHISQPGFTLPEAFLRFAGLRLAQLIAELTPPEKRDDWNVVRAMVNGNWTLIKIGRFNRTAGRLMFDFAEPGHLGMGMITVDDVDPEYRKKLATILDRIEGV